MANLSDATRFKSSRSGAYSNRVEVTLPSQ